MVKGVSKTEIEKCFKEINNDDLNGNFFCVYPSDKINKFIMFGKMTPVKIYSFLISNTDRSHQGRTH